jgi:hypothetical protein
MKRTMIGFAGAVVAAAVWLTPLVAVADDDKNDRHAGPQQPVAAVFMYEVAEGLSFKAPKHPKDAVEAKRRLADATLLGKKIVPLTADPSSPWTSAHFISADAKSEVSLATGSGPIRGSFDLLQDLDPTRESLDTLLISATGWLRGVLDLRTAMQGYATTSGTWEIKRSGKGTFAGVFLIPFPVAPGVYAYVDVSSALQLDRMGLSLCANPIPLSPDPAGPKGCLLGSDEFALGIPLTKAVLILSQ